MKKDGQIIIADNFSMRAVDYASQGNTDLGIRGSGKSYTASKIAEQLLHAGIPILVLDPTAVWQNLRNGVNGHKGFPVVVVGGLQADIPLPLEEGKIDGLISKIIVLVRAAMQQGISIVIDLFAMPKSNWRKIVIACIDLLLKENYLYGIRHVILEEAAEFIPQKPNPGNEVVYGLIEQMARTGRNFGIGFTLINQRAEEIAKAVFELCEMVFVHRQKGKNSLKSIREWLDHQAIEDAKGMVASIPKLANGECWVISDQGEQRIKVKQKETFHPSPKEGKVTVPHDVKKADTAAFIKAMLTEMEKAKKGKDQELKNVKSLQDEVFRLKAELNKKQKTMQPVAANVKHGKSDDKKFEAIANQLAQTKAYVFELQNEILQYQANEKKMTEIFERADSRIQKSVSELQAATQLLSNRDLPKIVRTKNVKTETVRTKSVQIPASNGQLTGGKKMILAACADYKDRGGLRRDQMVVLTGYKKTSRDIFIGQLKQDGYLEQNGDRLKATAEGIAALGPDYEPLPRGSALREYWLNKLGGGEKEILQVLIEGYPTCISRNDLGTVTDYKKTSRDIFIGKLIARELVSKPGHGLLKASDFLFD